MMARSEDFYDDKSKCETCENIFQCTKLCEAHTGHAFYNFLKWVQTIETRIGDIEQNNIGKDSTLYGVSGHEIYGNGDQPSWSVRPIQDLVIHSGDKFKVEYGISSANVLTQYTKKAKNITDEEESELIKKIDAINKMRMIALPLRPDITYNINYTDENKKKVVYNDLPVHCVVWKIRKDNYKLEGTIRFLVQAEFEENNRTLSFPIEEYNRKFFLSNSEFNKKDKFRNSAIELDSYGFIKPIELVEGDYSMIIDGTYIYSSIYGSNELVGAWDVKDNIRYINNFKPSVEATKFINKNKYMLQVHRKYMVPYKMYDTHKIKLK